MFKKNDSVYFHSHKHGTIPAEVLKVGQVHADRWTKFQGQLFIKGDFPKTELCCWVSASNCELQSESAEYVNARKIGSEDIENDVETEFVYECFNCSRKTSSDISLGNLVKEMNNDGWRFAVIEDTSGIFCPYCISDSENKS